MSDNDAGIAATTTRTSSTRTGTKTDTTTSNNVATVGVPATSLDTSTSTSTRSTTRSTTTSGIAVPTSSTSTDIDQSEPTSSTLPTTTSTSQSRGTGISLNTTNTAAGANNTSTPGLTTDDMPYSTGDIAGAVVGSIVGAAIITFLVTWFFFRKRSKRSYQSQRSPSHRSRDHRSPTRHAAPVIAAAGMKEKSASSSDASGFSWQAYLPQSADDQTISRDVKTLFDQIELHVDNYYTKANVRVDSSTSRALSHFNDDNLLESIDALIANPQTTLPTIKHCIAKTLIARMSPGYERMSLLPEYFSAEPTKLNSSMPPGEQTAVQQAYSQWRLLNAYLHPHPEQDRSYQQRRELAAQDVSGQMSTAFAPWQGPKENIEGLKQHEKSLAMRASDVATLIMSQPSAYEFRWSASSRSFVVFPGFVKTTDERGRPLEQPQSLVKPVVARG